MPLTDPEMDFSARTRSKVLHGRRQLVPLGVGLSPATSATPIFSCQQVKLGTLKRLPRASGEEGGDDVRSSWPLRPGLHTCYNGVYRVLQTSDGKPITKSTSQFGLQAATRLHEVGIASNRASAMAR